MNILIVDDEYNIRELMRKYLSLEGLQSDGAENGLSAQRLLREHHYDACLIDLKMPGMDGLSLISWMRQEGFRMLVIMMMRETMIIFSMARTRFFKRSMVGVFRFKSNPKITIP